MATQENIIWTGAGVPPNEWLSTLSNLCRRPAQMRLCGKFLGAQKRANILVQNSAKFSLEQFGVFFSFLKVCLPSCTINANKKCTTTWLSCVDIAHCASFCYICLQFGWQWWWTMQEKNATSGEDLLLDYLTCSTAHCMNTRVKLRICAVHRAVCRVYWDPTANCLKTCWQRKRKQIKCRKQNWKTNDTFYLVIFKHVYCIHTMSIQWKRTKNSHSEVSDSPLRYNWFWCEPQTSLQDNCIQNASFTKLNQNDSQYQHKK